MPRIPIAEPSVQVQTAPSVRQSLTIPGGAFGSDTAEALMRAGNLGQNITAELQQRRNAQEAQKAYLDASTELQNFMHNPDDGIYTRKGVNAPGAFQAVMDKIPEIEGKHTAKLSRAQRELFDKFWKQSTQPELRGAMNHEREQITFAKAATAKALTELNIQNMEANYGDEESLKTFDELIRSSVQAEAGANGWSLAQHQLMEQEALTKGYAGAFAHHFESGDYERAEALLKAHGEKMQPSIVQKLEAQLLAKKQDAMIQSESDMIVAKFAGDEGGALAYIKENLKGDIRDGVTEEVIAQFQRERRIADEQMTQTYWTRSNEIRESGSRAAGLAIARRETDPELRGKLFNAVDGIFPQRRGGGESDEAKDQKKVMKYLVASGMTRLLKSEFDENPDALRTQGAIAAELAKVGVFDVEVIKDVYEYANKGGVYGNVNRESVHKVLQTMGRGDKYKTPADVPMTLVDTVAEEAKRKQVELSPREMEDVVKGGLAVGMGDEPGWFGTTRKTQREWYEQLDKKGQSNFDVLSKMAPDDRAQFEAFSIWQRSASGSKEKLSADKLNALARSWLPAATEEVPNAGEAKKFYDFARRQKVVRYNSREGDVIEEQVTPEKLRDPNMWNILFQKYKARGR